MYTTCDVKRDAKDIWKPLRPRQSEKGFPGFLCGIFNLSKSAMTLHKFPAEKTVLLTRPISEGAIIGDVNLPKKLRDLIETVYIDRTSNCNWDLSCSADHRQRSSEEVDPLEVDEGVPLNVPF